MCDLCRTQVKRALDTLDPEIREAVARHIGEVSRELHDRLDDEVEKAQETDREFTAAKKLNERRWRKLQEQLQAIRDLATLIDSGSHIEDDWRELAILTRKLPTKPEDLDG